MKFFKNLFRSKNSSISIQDVLDLCRDAKFVYSTSNCIREKMTNACPICYAILRKTGKLYPNDQTIKAGKTIGLSPSNSVIITAATDNWDYSHNFNPELRKQFETLVLE